MADEIGTPGSNADSSINAGKPSANKDKGCPFCNQPFTSSSLGRHLDLYIKEKNPKPPDGLHDVDEIRKMRGGITRRQPRNSLSKREGSAPNTTPRTNGNRGIGRSPNSEAGIVSELQSPKVRTQPMDVSQEGTKGGVKLYLNSVSWHSTGVMNDIPPVMRDADYGGVSEESPRRTMDPRRSVSRQMLAKTTFDQKQKMMEALDNARAAELALREVLGSIKAATDRTQAEVSPFDYNPLSLDFPALALHCLPPPPTLNQVTTIPSPASWSIAPPEQQQYDALRAHFHNAFHSWRISSAMASNHNPDDLHYGTNPNAIPSNADMRSRMLATAQELEEKVSSHLHTSYSHWASLAPQTRNELWRLELARSVGKKESSLTTLKSTMEKVLQENTHLRAQVEQLSRCQQPREFQMMPPSTIPINSRIAVELGEMGVHSPLVGLQMSDKDDSVPQLVEKAISRWRTVVQAGRRDTSGMTQQRALSTPVANNHNMNAAHLSSHGIISNYDRDADMDADADADADADGDADAEGEDTSYDIPAPQPSVPMPGHVDASMMSAYGNRSNHGGTNGTGNREMDMRWTNGTLA